MEYYFIIAGAVFALIFFACLLIKFDDIIKRIAIYTISLVLSYLITKGMLKLISEIISSRLNTYIINFSFYYTMILFLSLSAVINKLCQLKVDSTGKLVALPLMVFLVVSKLGCYFNDCCYAVIGNSIIPLNLIESFLALVIIILVMINKIKPNLYLVIIYSIFRFITEFYKVSFIYENVLGITFSQVIYLVVIIATFLIIKINLIRGKRL